MGALSGEQSWRPEVAVRQAEEKKREEEEAWKSDVYEEEHGCLGWTPRL